MAHLAALTGDDTVVDPWGFIPTDFTGNHFYLSWKRRRMREGVMLLFQSISDENTHSIIQSDLYLLLMWCHGTDCTLSRRNATSKHTLGLHPAALPFQSTLVFLSVYTHCKPNNNKIIKHSRLFKLNEWGVHIKLERATDLFWSRTAWSATV